MKFAILVSALALCVCASVVPRNQQHGDGEIVGLARQLGLTIDFFDVKTSDGYILQLFRILRVDNSRQGSAEDQSRENSRNSGKQEDKKGVVLLMHGFLSSAEDFLYGGSESLVVDLINKGYDVFLGNTRGSKYGRNHINLDPRKDAAFWRYCQDQIGTKDMPAIIEKIQDITKAEKISLISHMEATTYTYIMLSEIPELNNKLEKMISLGPIVFLKNAQHEWFDKAINKNKAWLVKTFGVSTFQPSHEVIEELKTRCMSENFEENICSNVYFLLNGYNSKNWNEKTIREVLMNLPSTGSVREFMHLVQMKKSGRFESFDESIFNQQSQSSSTTVKEYDLSKVTVPVGILYAAEDKISKPTDVQFLISKLPNVFAQQQLNEMSNNLELLWSRNVQKVNEFVIKYLGGNAI